MGFVQNSITYCIFDSSGQLVILIERLSDMDFLWNSVWHNQYTCRLSLWKIDCSIPNMLVKEEKKMNAWHVINYCACCTDKALWPLWKTAIPWWTVTDLYFNNPASLKVIQQSDWGFAALNGHVWCVCSIIQLELMTSPQRKNVRDGVEQNRSVYGVIRLVGNLLPIHKQGLS